jgi:hypothetical protein
MFYNPKRRHGYAKGASPIEFENQFLTGNKVSRKAGAIQLAEVLAS